MKPAIYIGLMSGTSLDGVDAVLADLSDGISVRAHQHRPFAPALRAELLDPSNGSIVTDTRANIHYLCTEYGCVNLKGLTSWEKAEALISVAHPDFREELIREADKLHIWRRSNKI